MTPRRRIFTFALDDDLAFAMKKYKAEHGVPESEQVRRALRAWLPQKVSITVTSLEGTPKVIKVDLMNPEEVKRRVTVKSERKQPSKGRKRS